MNPKSKKDPPSTPYNASFWSDYQLLLDFPITPKIVEDLEVNGPLKIQFTTSSQQQ